MKKNIIIMVLFLVISVLCVLLGISMDKKCDVTPNVSDNKEDVKYLESTNEEVQALYDRVSYGIGMPCGLSSIYFTSNKVGVSDISYETLFRIAAYHITKKDYKVNFSIDSVTANIRKTFGSKIQFKAASYNSTPRYKFNYDTATYEYVSDRGLQKVCTEDKNIVRVVMGTKSKSKFEIFVRVIFNKDGKYYKDPSYNVVLNNLIRENGKVTDTDNNIRQGTLYKMTFVNENNGYVFSSSEMSR